MKSWIYKIPEESEEDLLVWVMAMWTWEYQVLVIICTRTWYVDTVYV